MGAFVVPLIGAMDKPRALLYCRARDHVENSMQRQPLTAALLLLCVACGGDGDATDATPTETRAQAMTTQTITWPAGGPGKIQGSTRLIGSAASYTNRTASPVTVALVGNVQAQGSGAGGTAFAQLIVEGVWQRKTANGVVAGGGAQALELVDGAPMQSIGYRNTVIDVPPGETITLDLWGGGVTGTDFGQWPAGSFSWVVESVDLRVTGP